MDAFEVIGSLREKLAKQQQEIWSLQSRMMVLEKVLDNVRHVVSRETRGEMLDAIDALFQAALESAEEGLGGPAE